MSLWVPEIEADSSRAKYLAIADAIGADIEAGRLAAGTRLPPHRDLATKLGVTIGTVSRAYAEAQRRGLVRGEVGRGTFVLEERAAPGRIALEIPSDVDASATDLSRNYTLLDPDFAPLKRATQDFLRASDLSTLVVRHPSAGARADRAAGAQWLARFGVEASADDVVVTCGVQHGLTVTLAAICEPGDLVACEALTYPGLKSVAQFLRLRLEGVALDDEGIVPDAFRALCERDKPRALYCTPSVQNPTGILVTERRRQQIVDIANEHDVLIIEDETYAFLVEDPPPPFTQLAPERTFYVTALSKSILPGLRTGYVRAPQAYRDRVADGVMATTWMPAPPMTALATHLITEQVVDVVTAHKRKEARARLALAVKRLSPHLRANAVPTALHIWIELPHRATDYVAAAKARGVIVTPPEQFTVSRRTGIPQAVRACIGAPKSRSLLEAALDILRDGLATA